jgi:hypothetical protein
MARKRLSKSSLLWFIRSRSYVTLADVRRRFGVELGEDVSGIRGPQGLAFVGLPSQQARMLQELWCEGKIGLEFAHDIMAPSVNGVYGIFGPGGAYIQPAPAHVGADYDAEPDAEECSEAASA